jgi:hypothetical protein
MKNPKDIPASQCQRYLKKVLSKGGSATIRVGKEIRCLQHFRSMHRPIKRLPWPLSKLQPFWFEIRFQETERGPVIGGIQFPPPLDLKSTNKWEVVRFSNKQLQEGFAFFLRDASPDEMVLIDYNRRL